MFSICLIHDRHRWLQPCTQRAAWRRIAALLALSITVCWANQACAETWAERLGYPAGAKVLVLHANELGMCYETNAAGTELLEAGVVRSAGAMVPGPWFADLAAWCKAHPDADVGLELTLNSEWDHYRWRPVAVGGLVPSLVDADGFLWRAAVRLLKQTMNRLRKEFKHG